MGKEKYEVELAANTKEAQKNVDDLNKKVKDLGKEAERTGKKLGNELSAGMQLGNEAARGLDRYTGGLASKLLKVGKAAKVSGKAMKAAMISTGIGALVVALGLVVEYWDDIVGLVDGVSSEQKDLLESTQKTLDVQEQQLKSTGQMENTLKLQGKSEKEIRDLKRQQTDEIITSTELLLEQQKSQKKAQVEAAERNQKIAQGIIAFLTLPLTIILGTIDGITNSLANLGLIDEATTLTEDYLDFTSSLLFDPEEIAAAGDETINETENKLRQLKNTRDGFALKDKEDSKKNADEKTQDEIQAEKDKAAALESIRKALIDTEAEERAEKLRKIGEDYDEQIRLAEQYYGKESQKVLELRAAQKLAEDEQQAIFDEQDRVKEQKRLDGIKAIQDQFKEQTEIEKLEEQQVKDLAELERFDATEAQKLAIVEHYELLKQGVKDKTAAQDKELDRKVLNAKLNMAKQGFDLLADIAGKDSKTGKAMAIASATISGTLGVMNAFTTANKSPITVAFPAYPYLQAGLAGAAALKNIASIKSVNPSGRGNTGTVPTGGGGGGSAPTPESVPPAFNIVGASGTNQLADAIGGQTQQPTKAYVVASDVSTAQEMDRNIIEGASIG